ncbi:MAG: hypothetical protein ABSG40_11945 [Terriglobales bacterium]|jgi:hypothetical protein
MKRLVVTAVLLLLCISFPNSLEARDKAPSVDMSKMNRIFLGWVDVDPNNFAELGYSKAEWLDVIGNANAVFQHNCQSKYLTGRTITAAKDKGDENAAGNDLYIKFSDASFGKNYRLKLSVHFIDPKTNSEIASIPVRTYTGRLCGLVSCLEKELDEVGRKLQLEVAGKPKENQ